MEVEVGGHVAFMGKLRYAYRVLVRRPEGKRPLGGPRRRGEGNSRMDLEEKEWEGVDWIHLAQGSYEHVNEPSGSIKSG
jgi:hypothetical protein